MKRNEYRSGENALDVRNPVLRAFNYIVICMAVIAVFTPIFILIINSFKGDKEYMYSGVFQLPESFLNVDNFKYFITHGKLFLGFRNTFFLIFVSTTVSVLLGTMVAFAAERFDFKFKRLIMAAFMLAISIPTVTTQVATFSLIKSLGLYNTIFSCMLLYLGTNVIQIYIFLQFIGTIPVELDESAKIDGARYFRIFFSIILPLMKPAIATTTILKVIEIYNDMFTPYLYMPDPELRTVTTALMMFNAEKNSSWNVMAAGILLIMIPTVLIYLFSQKYIISGVGAGAVKG